MERVEALKTNVMIAFNHLRHLSNENSFSAHNTPIHADDRYHTAAKLVI